MPTIFTRIINREIPAYILKEDNRYLCMLDAFPTTRGHALVVPKTETDRLFDLDDRYLEGMLSFAKPVANAIREVTGADRVNIMTFGFEVPHAHLHLVPMNDMAIVGDFMKKIKQSPKEFEEMQRQIIEKLAG